MWAAAPHPFMEAPVRLVKWLIIMMPLLVAALAGIFAEYKACFKAGNTGMDIFFVAAETALFMLWTSVSIGFLNNNKAGNGPIMKFCTVFFIVFILFFDGFCGSTGVTAGIRVAPVVFIIYGLVAFRILRQNIHPK